MWRATALPVRILVLDARSCLPILLAVVDWSLKTLIFSLIATAVFGLISFFGLTLPAALRWGRRLLVGRTRTAVPTWKRRRFS